MPASRIIREALATLFPPGAVVEVRMLHTNRGTISGYFDDMEKLAECAEEASGQVPAVYVTLNECRRDLLARAHNRVQGYSRITTSDDQILHRRWLGIDFDPVRPSGISATDSEHDAALARAIDCQEWLRERGWPEPLRADSGNGGHLLYPIDLPNEPAARDLLSRVLSALAFRFDDALVKIDQATFNASRIWKLYGTLACKGDDMPDRPHRLAQVLEGFELREPVTVDQLGDVAQLLPTEPKRESRPATGEPFDLDRWIADHGLNLEAASWQGGRKWVFGECPWNPDHTDRSAYLVQFPSGAIAAGCHHNGCAQNHWHELRDRLEPGWRDRIPRNGAQPTEGAAREATGAAREEAPHPAESSEPWEPIVDLLLGDLPEFPVDRLPIWMGAQVLAVATETQTPPDLGAMVGLSVVATAVQKRIEACPRHGWTESLSLFTVTALGSGNVKSGVFGRMTDPISAYEIELTEQMRAEVESSRLDREIIEGRIKRLKDQATKATNVFDRERFREEAVELASDLARRTALASPRFLADDVTPEKLAILLSEQGGRISVMSPEVNAFEIMAGRYSSGQTNFTVYLKGHTGDDIRVDRVNRASLVIHRPAITMGLLAQPGVLVRLSEQPEFRERGLLARFLFCLPKSRVGSRVIDSEPVPEGISSVYDANVRKLLMIVADTDARGFPCPHQLLFSDGAKAAISTFRHWLEPQLAEGAELGYLADWCGKLHGTLVRIAALMHLAEQVGEKFPWEERVQAEMIDRAEAICRYLIAHAKAAFRLIGTDPAILGARKILAWLIRKRTAQLTVRQVHHAMQGTFELAEELKGPLEVLIEHGYLRILPVERKAGAGRPPSPIYEVNPALYAIRGDPNSVDCVDTLLGVKDSSGRAN